MRFKHGFTLIELIIVIAIIGILLAVTIPNMKGWQSDYQLQHTVRSLFYVIQHARLVAVKENNKVIVTFDPAASGRPDEDYLVFVDNGLDKETFWTREPDEKIIKYGSIPTGIDVINVSFAGGVPKLRFDHMGLPNGFGGHVYLTNSRKKFLGIHVNLNGRPRIVRSKDGRKGTWK